MISTVISTVGRLFVEVLSALSWKMVGFGFRSSMVSFQNKDTSFGTVIMGFRFMGLGFIGLRVSLGFKCPTSNRSPNWSFAVEG